MKALEIFRLIKAREVNAILAQFLPVEYILIALYTLTWVFTTELLDWDPNIINDLMYAIYINIPFIFIGTFSPFFLIRTGHFAFDAVRITFFIGFFILLGGFMVVQLFDNYIIIALIILMAIQNFRSKDAMKSNLIIYFIFIPAALLITLLVSILLPLPLLGFKSLPAESFADYKFPACSSEIECHPGNFMAWGITFNLVMLKIKSIFFSGENRSIRLATGNDSIFKE